MITDARLFTRRYKRDYVANTLAMSGLRPRIKSYVALARARA